MYDAVLLPTDGGEEMERIARHAITLAAQFDATIHALHVVDDRAYASVPEDARDQVRETLRKDAQDATKAVATRALEADLPVTREVRWGNPPASIISYASEKEIDLIIMGTHGRTGYDRYLLGSVAEKVVRAAPIPVLTINVGEQLEDAADGADITIPNTNIRDSDIGG